ncbi:hypothetical protein NDU88_009831 [Pleurodeles waltl]|uniref:Uncharacterized protein n=1 Tax=Pleurodeles waltl TaxID=8319 RepID=A0AAV7RWC3_PLEWA|nr:hypothetical protein NDU88_009831 [Pleurodeles waltl]
MSYPSFRLHVPGATMLMPGEGARRNNEQIIKDLKGWAWSGHELRWPPEERAPWSGGPRDGGGGAGCVLSVPHRLLKGRWGPPMPGLPPGQPLEALDPISREHEENGGLPAYDLMKSRGLA